jgi:hypothetical protein
MRVNTLGVQNSLYNNIRKKGEMNKKAGIKPKRPTMEMLKQERSIKPTGTARKLTFKPNYASKYSQD